jgi:transcriptional regulator with XRE-family HTH domain
MREPSLRELRNIAGWTLNQAAKSVGIASSALSEIETRNRRVNANTEAKIRRVLVRAIAKRARRIDGILATKSNDVGQHLRSERATAA